MISLGIAPFGDLLFAAWQGGDGDQGLYYSSFDGSGWAPQAQISGAQAQIPATVPPPNAGLGSNSNYILYSNCSPLINLSAAITEDLVWQSTSGTSPTGNGFGFQLNAYSPPDSQCVFQQYIIALLGTELKGRADNRASQAQLLNQMVDLIPLTNVTIPAG